MVTEKEREKDLKKKRERGGGIYLYALGMANN